MLTVNETLEIGKERVENVIGRLRERERESGECEWEIERERERERVENANGRVRERDERETSGKEEGIKGLQFLI